MVEAEFDKFAEEYRTLHAGNIALTGEDPDYFADYKVRDLVAELPAGGGDLAILDFGAGVGTSVPFMRKRLAKAEIVCVDVSSKSIEVGSRRLAGQANFLRFDGRRIPLTEGRFHVAFAACVFHHIAPEEHVALLREFMRVLRPDGIAFIYEHNPLNPLTVRAVNACPFDENARLISARAMRRQLLAAGFRSARVRYRVFFPRSLAVLRPLEKWLTWAPFGAQYYLVASK